MVDIAQLKDLIVNGVGRFIGKVYASEFIGKLTGNADTSTKATQDESGNNIKSSYASSISISDHTITLKNKNGTSLGTVTVPDNNTWRGIQNNLTSDSTTDSLSAAQGKVLKGLVDGKAASSHSHNYLPLSGGTVTGETQFNNYLKLNAWSGYGTGTANFWYDANNKFVEIQNATDLKLAGTKVSKEGHTHSAYVNQNAFSNVAVGSTTVSADSATDTLTLVAGSNVTITPDATNDKITISSAHPTITTSTDSTSTASPAHGGTFTAVDSVTKDNNGHVTKINTKTITLPSVDDALSSTSTNPVQNKIINTALSKKADYEEGTWTPYNDYGSIDTSVYEFTNATYTRIGNTVILYARATAKVQSTRAELCVYTGSFPYPYRFNKMLNLFANDQVGGSTIGNFYVPNGKISFGNFTFAIESYGLTDVEISIIYRFA